MTDEKSERFVSTAAAAEAVGLAPNTLRKWMREGKLPACRAGRRVLLKLSDVRALLVPWRQQEATHASP